MLEIEILTHPTKLSPLHQLGSCLFFRLSLLGMAKGSERSFVPTFTAFLGARALLPDFPFYLLAGGFLLVILCACSALGKRHCT